MLPADNNHGSSQMRGYCRADSAVFLRTKDKFGGLSNMAGGFPLMVNDVSIRTSEALYQACRFPHMPEVQSLIIEQKSPMTAKMKGKPFRQDSRSDWDEVKVKIMRWCLEVKLAENWHSFSELLLSTGDSPIVEHSRRDDFWGAKPINEHTLVGVNALGRLLMGLRHRIKTEPLESFLCVKSLNIPNFHLFGSEISEITSPSNNPPTSSTSRGTLLVSSFREIAESPTNPPDIEIRRTKWADLGSTAEQLSLEIQ